MAVRSSSVFSCAASKKQTARWRGLNKKPPPLGWRNCAGRGVPVTSGAPHLSPHPPQRPQSRLRRTGRENTQQSLII
eukprot:3844442-Rhodomonas_salina.1